MIKDKNSQVEKPPFDLRKSIEDTIQEMNKAKDDDPNLFIPNSFLENYDSPEMNEFVQRAFEYCTTLCKVECSDKKDMKKNSRKSVSLDLSKINFLAIEMAKTYGKLMITAFNQKKSSKDEENFFETLIYYIAKVMQPVFEKEQIKWLEDELNRLFRSTAFNIARRNHIESEKKKKFPNLKVPKRNHDSIINSIIVRNSIPKERLRIILAENTDLKPCYVNLTPHKALTARSPMMSLILPSPSDRVRAFEL